MEDKSNYNPAYEKSALERLKNFKPLFLSVSKTIYNINAKKPDMIHGILHQVIENCKLTYPEYEFQQFDGTGAFNNDGSCTYTIVLKRITKLYDGLR